MGCCDNGPTEKKAPAVWLEGQRQEARGVRDWTPAFNRSMGLVSAFYSSLLESLAISPSFPALQQLERAPWSLARQEMADAWMGVSARVMRVSARAALDGVQKGAVQKVSEEELVRFARQWAGEHALLMAQRATLGSMNGIKAVLDEALAGDLTVVETMRALRDQVGLTVRQAGALGRQRRLLAAAGTPMDQIERVIRRRATKMRRQRAETIARTEVNQARNVATLNTWKQARTEGLLSRNVQKTWVAVSACPVCEEIVAWVEEQGGGIPLDSAFWSATLGQGLQGPPAHPRCRCSPALVRG